MSLRSAEVEEVASELTRALGGAFVQKVFSPSGRRLYLELRLPGRSVLVLVCTEPEVARLTVVEARVASPPQATPFQSKARAELIGKKLVAVRVPAPHEVTLQLEHDGVHRTVFAELGGRGDLVLLDEEGRALAAGERRFLLPRAPNERDAAPGVQPSRLHVSGLVAGAATGAGAREVTGAAAREVTGAVTGSAVAAVSGSVTGAATGAATGAGAREVTGAVTGSAVAAVSGSATGAGAREVTGSSTGFIEGSSRATRAATGAVAGGAVDAVFPLATAAEALYAERERALRLRAARASVVQPLRTKLARLERTAGKVREEASRGPKAAEHQRVGALISQNLFRLTRGMREATLTEYSEEGEREVHLKLDPSRAPKDEAEWHFHQYRRLTRGVEQAQRRLAVLEADVATTRTALERALGEESAEKLEEEAGPAATHSRPVAQVHQPFVEYRTRRGERILVGRGGADNDELTFKIARPQDLWLHARGVTGAHVVVPLERNAVASTDLLLDAAHLALHHAKTKGEAGGEVSYVLAKFVKRPKGGAPGQVHYTREKTFWVRLEPERLAALLKGRQGVVP